MNRADFDTYAEICYVLPLPDSPPDERRELDAVIRQRLLEAPNDVVAALAMRYSPSLNELKRRLERRTFSLLELVRLARYQLDRKDQIKRGNWIERLLQTTMDEVWRTCLLADQTEIDALVRDWAGSELDDKYHLVRTITALRQRPA